jgi:hypothetical protein
MSIMCLVFLGFLINIYIEKREAEQPVTSQETGIGGCTTDSFYIKDLTWHKEEKKALGIIDSLTVTNKGEHDCKDIRGLIRFLSSDGTELGKRDFIVSEYIRSKETKTFQRIPINSIAPSGVHDVTMTLEGTVVHQEKQD